MENGFEFGMCLGVFVLCCQSMKFGTFMCIERVCVENDLCENQILALSVRGVSALVIWFTSVYFITMLQN